MALPGRFGLSWSAFRVSGAPELTPVEDIELALEQRRASDEQVGAMEGNLRRECQQFVEQYVLGFRHEVAAFCDQVKRGTGSEPDSSTARTTPPLGACPPFHRHNAA